MKKVFGWFLLIIGVLIIFWGIYSSFEIFTAKRPPYEIFKTPEVKEVSLEREKTEKDLQVQVQEEMEQTIKEQFEKMLPQGSLVKFLNLISWSIFIGILVYAGGRLSALGISLLKT